MIEIKFFFTDMKGLRLFAGCSRRCLCMITRHNFLFSRLVAIKVKISSPSKVFLTEKSWKDGSAQRECKFCCLLGYVCCDIQRDADGETRFSKLFRLLFLWLFNYSKWRSKRNDTLLGIFSSVHYPGRFPRFYHVCVSTYSNWKFGTDCFWERFPDKAL